MNIQEMTRKQFEVVPHRKTWDERVTCNSIVILPTRRKHESGYRVMDFVAVQNGEPICLLSGSSDILHIDGIGGWGQWSGKIPDLIKTGGWSIDCLPKSGLLQMWSSRYRNIICGPALSSMEIFAERV